MEKSKCFTIGSRESSPELDAFTAHLFDSFDFKLKTPFNVKCDRILLSETDRDLQFTEFDSQNVNFFASSILFYVIFDR